VPSSTIPHLAIRRIARGQIGGSSRLSGPEVFKWLYGKRDAGLLEMRVRARNVGRGVSFYERTDYAHIQGAITTLSRRDFDYFVHSLS
jgi:hypothetical protein